MERRKIPETPGNSPRNQPEFCKRKRIYVRKDKNTDLYIKYAFLRNSDVLTQRDREYFDRVSERMADTDAMIALHKLSNFIQRYYGKKPIILLGEYDTPMQEAYVNGYWDELVSFTRSLLNCTFKTNPYFDRVIMTGIIKNMWMYLELRRRKYRRI